MIGTDVVNSGSASIPGTDSWEGLPTPRQGCQLYNFLKFLKKTMKLKEIWSIDNSWDDGREVHALMNATDY